MAVLLAWARQEVMMNSTCFCIACLKVGTCQVNLAIEKLIMSNYFVWSVYRASCDKQWFCLDFLFAASIGGQPKFNPTAISESTWLSANGKGR